jgi:hypothetical protein
MIEFRKPRRAVSRVFLHCSASDHLHHDDIAVLRQWHLKRGFDDVGYHYLITFDGRVQAGRSLEKQPAAQAGHNTGSIAICLSGGQNGQSGAFTTAQFRALRDLVAQIDLAYGGTVTFHGHQEVAKRSCPVFDYRRELGLSAQGYRQGPRPSLSQSRTIGGARVAALGLATMSVSEVVQVGEVVSPVLSVALQTVPLLALSLVALGLGVVLWARMDDHARGLR